MSHFNFHLLFGSSVAVSDNRNDTAQFHHFSKRCGNNRRVVQLKWHRPRNMQSGGQLSQYHVAQNLGAVVVVFVGIFYETEAVHVAHKRFAVCPKIVNMFIEINRRFIKRKTEFIEYKVQDKTIMCM